jgi:hypothetical protein
MKKIIALAAILFSLAAPAFAQTAAPGLIGTYKVTGTDPDGTPYKGESTLVITAEPSGALGLNWDNGDYVGVGQVSGTVLGVAVVDSGKNTIMMMNLNPDGTVSGKYWRRTDAGAQGTEVWTKK